ncbi:tetratricopeptide repeat protein [Pleionea sediminis]|uniref:tetratricopeptide repeat protein n=1 Tax=Pleionea sediminis TaxID=2569479 RepID=UPI00118704CD|nr:tetratricopeptide repeat protein [Pleionea sediminis]
MSRQLGLFITIFMTSFVVFGCSKMKTSIEKSESTLIEDANQGDVSAAHALCYRYSYGVNIEADDKKAFYWCERATITQDPRSMTLLADLFYEGRGTEKNYRKAAKLYYFAAERGIEKAMFMLYHIYANGQGVVKDETEAKYYLNRAAQRNYQPALELKQKLFLDDV